MSNFGTADPRCECPQVRGLDDGCRYCKPQMIIDQLEQAIKSALNVMGPTTPKCCEGCSWEWGEALAVLKAARMQTGGES